MKKGISPLIAAVVLIAFVIAIASLTSGTFTNLTSEWGEDVQDKGQTTLSCTQTNLEINTVRWNGQNLSLSVHNVGSNKLTGLTAEVTSEEREKLKQHFSDFNRNLPELIGREPVWWSGGIDHSSAR